MQRINYACKQFYVARYDVHAAIAIDDELMFELASYIATCKVTMQDRQKLVMSYTTSKGIHACVHEFL